MPVVSVCDLPLLVFLMWCSGMYDGLTIDVLIQFVCIKLSVVDDYSLSSF